MTDEKIEFPLNQTWLEILNCYGFSNNFVLSHLAKKIVIDALEKFHRTGERIAE